MILPLSQNGFFQWVPDKAFLKMLYWSELDKKLNLKEPVLFSEKIQWLKLYDRNPEYTKLVDKYTVKKIISDKIGEQYIIPTLGVWESVQQIDFNQLPNSFVLKCTHDSGGIVICKDKSLLDTKKAIDFLSIHMKRNSYKSSREWPYKGVTPKIIAEELLVDSEHEELIDYKFYCFNGKPVYCQIIQNRHTDETIDFYNMEWVKMPFTGLGINSKNGVFINKPCHYEKMIDIATQLADGTKFVRIDLYNVKGRIYFGEFTLYPKSGLGRFKPDEWNIKIGKMIDINNP
jgi:hypothetical protein